MYHLTFTNIPEAGRKAEGATVGEMTAAAQRYGLEASIHDATGHVVASWSPLTGFRYLQGKPALVRCPSCELWVDANQASTCRNCGAQVVAQ